MIARTEAEYEDHSARYVLRSFDYQKQYSHLYTHRLTEMTALLKKRVQRKWGTKYPIHKLCDLREEQEEEESCIIIGTIFKHQMHKPSILREISEENQLAPQPPRLHYADPEDKLLLEDELQRVRLYGKVDMRYMATGVVCAALGTVEEDGRFDVEEMLFYEAGPQRPLGKRGAAADKLLVLVSGLDVMQSHNYADALNLFQHWLGGHIGSGGQLVRLIVAGNAVRSTPEKRAPALQSRQAASEASNVTVAAVRRLDEWFAVWSQALPVDVMPGAHDPANFMLPQQPFHRCMFPQAARHSSFRSVPNPYACAVDEALIVGTAGQNVHDLLRSTALEDSLQALCLTLVWSHLAPTAPDTLACYPHVDSDPLILQQCPHIYFAGNCEAFATELHTSGDGDEKRTRLVCLPRFSQTQSVAVINLSSLDCHEVSFSVGSD